MKRLLKAPVTLAEPEVATAPEHVTDEAAALGKGRTLLSRPGKIRHREKHQSRDAVVWRQEHSDGPAKAGEEAPSPPRTLKQPVTPPGGSERNAEATSPRGRPAGVRSRARQGAGRLGRWWHTPSSARSSGPSFFSFFSSRMKPCVTAPRSHWDVMEARELGEGRINQHDMWLTRSSLPKPTTKLTRIIVAPSATRFVQFPLCFATPSLARLFLYPVRRPQDPVLGSLSVLGGHRLPPTNSVDARWEHSGQ